MTSKRNEPNREHESNRAISRRGGLKLIGAGLGLGAGVFSTAGRAASGSAADTQTKTYSLKQGDKCISLTPLVGSKPVEKLYDYTYPTKLFTGTPGSFGWSYSAEGMNSLLRDQTSVLFLYQGPNGLSLVIAHGRHAKNGSDPGGAVTFTITNFPESGKWFVKDDLYISKKTGKKYKTNYDTWSVDGDRSVVNWTYKPNRTDGGVLRGLGSSFDFTIHPAFNRQAKLYSQGKHGPITHWQALSGDLSSPKRIELRMDQPVEISSEPCSTSNGNGGNSDDQNDGTQNGDGNDRNDGSDGSGDSGTGDTSDGNCGDGTDDSDESDDEDASTDDGTSTSEDTSTDGDCKGDGDGDDDQGDQDAAADTGDDDSNC